MIARSLDLFVMGEGEAFHSAFRCNDLNWWRQCYLPARRSAVSVSGVIGFVGIVVPHLLRLMIGRAIACCCCKRFSGWNPVVVRRYLVTRGRSAAELPIGISPRLSVRRFSWCCCCCARALDCGAMTAVLSAEKVVYRAGRKTLCGWGGPRRQCRGADCAGWTNGAGKTTCCGVLSVELKPHQGRVVLKGRDIAAYSSRDLAMQRAVLSQSISVAFRSPSAKSWRWARRMCMARGCTNL